MSSIAVSRCIVCNSAVAIAVKRRVIHPCSEVGRSSTWLYDVALFHWVVQYQDC